MTSSTRCVLQYQAKPVAELLPEEINAWRQLRVTNHHFRSPFFAPGYTQLVGQCVGTVLVGLIRQQNHIVGVFPYQMESSSEAGPVGTIFCDYQGVIAAKDLPWTVQDLLSGLNLHSWHFDHVLANQHQWSDFHQIQDISWSIDLSNGFLAYEDLLRRNKRKQLAEVRRKKRMIEREVGSLHFVPHEVNHELLDLMLNWKSDQWARSGWEGRYTNEWELKLMHRLLETKQADFAGLFTILRVGRRPIAMHLGMRSNHTWHYWTTAYDPEFRRYSPGMVMLVDMLRYAPKIGIREFDMGKEDFEYKRRLHTHVIALGEGIARRDF